jgi:predicted small lipoprotein YifL
MGLPPHARSAILSGVGVRMNPGRYAFRFALVGVLAACAMLAGCGRKAGLDPPPAAAVADPAAAPVAAAPAQGNIPTGSAPRKGPDRPFILDWLIN